MALCPTIDCGVDPFADKVKKSKTPPPDPIPGEIKYLPLRYSLSELSDEKLTIAGVKREYYDKARSILNKVTPDIDPRQHVRIITEFDTYLKGIKHTTIRDRLREMSVVFDNSLIDSWYERWNSNLNNEYFVAERYIIPGFAKVRFAFDLKIVDGKEVAKVVTKGDHLTRYPCLPVSHPRYGLIYPLRGETFVTASEIMLALDAGCVIKALTSVELPVVMDGVDPVPRRLFFDHLADLTVKRIEKKTIIKEKVKSADEIQEAIVLERFIKEFMNSFYGKTAQAINYKKMHDPDTGLMVALGPSPISEACTAALATGLPRSALSAVLLAIDQYNRNKPLSDQIVVASCTTDGLLVGLPRPENISAASYYEVEIKKLKEPVVAGVGGVETETRCLVMKKGTPSVNAILELCGCGALVPMIESYMPIRQMRNARDELTAGDDDTFLEIKHFADHVAGIKTRGQLGWVHFEGEDIVTIQAKFGLKPPVTDIISTIADNKKLQLSMKELDAEYDRIMTVGGTAKATLECNWILEQIDRINNGEDDVFEYTFYGLKGFNEIIKGGDDQDLTQTKGERRFNADFDWKRKLEVVDGVVSPFSVPHLDLKEMRSHRSQVEKIRSWGKNATNEMVIQSEGIKNSKTRNTLGDAAKLVRLFLSDMFFDHATGTLKTEVFDKTDTAAVLMVSRINKIWSKLELGFERRALSKKALAVGVTPKPDKVVWEKSDLKRIASKDGWEPNVVIPRHRLEELLKTLCQEFEIDHATAYKRIFATSLKEKSDSNLRLLVALAILQAPGQGIEPFKRLYENHQLPTRDAIVREFHPHLSDALISSYEHNPYIKGQCQNRDKSKLEKYFTDLGLNRTDTDACVTIMLPVKEERSKAPSNPSEEKCIRLFAQALRMSDIVQPPRTPTEIVNKLERYGYRRDYLYSGKYSKFKYREINNTTENVKLIRTLSKRFNLDPANILKAMLDQ